VLVFVSFLEFIFLSSFDFRFRWCVNKKNNIDIFVVMLFGRRKYVFGIFTSCLTCALFVFASERSHSTVFGAHFKDACRGHECALDDAVSSSSANDNRNILPIHVVLTFTNAEYKRELQGKFAVTVSSLFQHSTRPVTLYIIGDTASQLLAENILAERVTDSNKYKVRIFVFLVVYLVRQ